MNVVFRESVWEDVGWRGSTGRPAGRPAATGADQEPHDGVSHEDTDRRIPFLHPSFMIE